MSEVSSGSHIALEANPTWWGSEPHFKRIVVKVIENTAALEANLLSGAIDMVAGELGLTLDQALAFEQRNSDRFRVHYQPGLLYEHVDVNLDNPILADLRVRKALMLGLDRQAMSEQLFQGRQPVADTKVSEMDWVYNDDVTRYSEDLEAAGALLDEAGWSEIRNGIRHNAAGQPLQLELMTTAGNRTRELVEQVLQSQWRRLGIDVRIRNEPARVFFGQTLDERRFTGLAMFAWSSAPEHVPRTIMHSEEIPDRGERVGRAELRRLRQSGGRRADRCDRDRARPRQARGDVAPPAGDLRRRAAGAAAVFPRRCAHLAGLAGRHAADRAHAPVHALGRAVGRRDRLSGR